MSSTNSSAFTGLGAVVSIGDIYSATSQTYTSISEITDVSFSGAKRDFEDVTSTDDTDGFRRKLATLADSGTVKLTMNRVAADAGQLALDAAFIAGDSYEFKVVEPLQSGQSTTGDSYVFSAFVSAGPEFSLSPSKAVTVTYSLEINGVVTYTIGS